MGTQWSCGPVIEMCVHTTKPYLLLHTIHVSLSQCTVLGSYETAFPRETFQYFISGTLVFLKISFLGGVGC